MPSSSSSRRRGTEEGEGASAPINLGGQGSTAARDRGKRERVGRRFDPRPHLVLGWRAEAGRREQAAAAEMAAAAALRPRRKG